MNINVGDSIPDWVMPSVSAERMRTMAAILRDPNPVHWDPDVVEEIGYGRHTINQGPLGLSYMINMLHSWTGHTSIRRIVMAAVPDPPGLAITALENLSETHDIEVLVVAHDEDMDHFDAWGRPDPGFWTGAATGLPETSIRVVGGTEDLALALVEELAAAANEGAAADDLALAVPDPEAAHRVVLGLEARGLMAADPAGDPLPASNLFPLTNLLIDWLREDRFSHAAALLRHPLMLQWLERETGADPTTLLIDLDKLHQVHLPHDEATAGQLASSRGTASTVLECLATLRKDYAARSPSPAGQLRLVLARLLDDVRIQPADPRGRGLRDAAEIINRTIDDVLLVSDRCPDEGQFHLLRSTLAEEEIPRPILPGSVLVEGWLEMAWNPAGRLWIGGLNEGSVPDGQLDDIFLPDRLRKQLGMRHDATRHARDAYLLTHLLRSRPPTDVRVASATSISLYTPPTPPP